MNGSLSSNHTTGGGLDAPGDAQRPGIKAWVSNLWTWWSEFVDWLILGIEPSPPTPDGFDDWTPMGQELWRIVTAPRFDRRTFQALLEELALTQRPVIARTAGAATELDYYEGTD